MLILWSDSEFGVKNVASPYSRLTMDLFYVKLILQNHTKSLSAGESLFSENQNQLELYQTDPTLISQYFIQS